MRMHKNNIYIHYIYVYIYMYIFIIKYGHSRVYISIGYTYKSLVVLLACLIEAVRRFDNNIQALSRPVMKVSNLDTIEFIFNFN